MSNPKNRHAHHALALSAGLIGAATALSRVLGFILTLFIAGLFGTTAPAQAFVVAFRIPNTMRDLAAEGASSSALVPVFSEVKATQEPRAFWSLADIVGTLMSVGLVVITLIGILAAPLIVPAIAPGFHADPEKLRLTITMTRWLFPYLALISLTAFTMSLLHAWRHFATPAFGQSLFNVMMIGACLLVMTHVVPGVVGLILGVYAGGIAQLGLNVAALMRRGCRFRWEWQPRHPEVRRIGRLWVPRTVGSAVYQLSVFVDTIFASLAHVVGEGGVAALFYASRLIQLPMALFGVAMAQASLPTLSAQAARKEFEAFRHTVVFGLRSVAFVTVPSAVGLAVMAHPIVTVLFQRGRFHAQDAWLTGSALAWYAVGLAAYASVKMLVNACYALQETRAPVKSAAIAVLVNVALNVVLMRPMGLGGIALATSISSLLNAFWLVGIVERRVGLLPRDELWRALWRISLAAGMMGGCVWSLWQASAGWLGGTTPAQVMRLGGTIGTGLVAYLAACWVLRVEEVHGLQRWIFATR
ncbi:MAG: murein biosynthesis integral membrane protein MurJ [Candidatus Omnitrophica bacterium]|nr:murein biosynthesis integral membrane protein MurJ [Candidatus Omnitrophota bacterium]